MMKRRRKGFMMRYAIRKIRQAIPTLISWLDKALTAVGDGGYDSTETVSEGDVLDYLLKSKIPLHQLQVRQHG